MASMNTVHLIGNLTRDVVIRNLPSGVSVADLSLAINDRYTNRNRNGGLGADDRAGCAMIWLMKDLGQSFLITNGEEQGRKGSTWLMSNNQDIAEEINNNHLFVIQLDRRNGKDFKCYSVGTNKFRRYVRKITGYSEPDRKASTDIESLCRRVAGVNLSIGYRDEHEINERFVLQEWQKTLKVCRK